MILLIAIRTTIEKAEVIDFYKALLDNQSSNYSVLISSFIAIAVILFGSNLIWNFVIAKKQIKSEVDEQIKEIAKELDSKYIQLFEKAIREVELKYETRFVRNETALLAIIAAQYVDKKEFTIALEYMSIILANYIFLKDDEHIGNSINNIYNILTKSDLVLTIIPENLNFDDIIKRINSAPDTLKDRKMEIIQILNLLKAKI